MLFALKIKVQTLNFTAFPKLSPSSLHLLSTGSDSSKLLLRSVQTVNHHGFSCLLLGRGGRPFLNTDTRDTTTWRKAEECSLRGDDEVIRLKGASSNISNITVGSPQCMFPFTAFFTSLFVQVSTCSDS